MTAFRWRCHLATHMPPFTPPDLLPHRSCAGGNTCVPCGARLPHQFRWPAPSHTTPLHCFAWLRSLLLLVFACRLPLPQFCLPACLPSSPPACPASLFPFCPLISPLHPFMLRLPFSLPVLHSTTPLCGPALASLHRQHATCPLPHGLHPTLCERAARTLLDNTRSCTWRASSDAHQLLQKCRGHSQKCRGHCCGYQQGRVARLGWWWWWQAAGAQTAWVA